MTVAVNCAVAPNCTAAALGRTETVIAGTVIFADADLVVSATEVAVRVTNKLLAGAAAGAVYVVAAAFAAAAGETVPHGAEEQDTDQVTPLFGPSFVTVAVNCVLAPACTVAVVGETVTVISGIVMGVEADFVASATDVAVMVTERLAARPLGAVYVVGAPLGVVVGETVPQADPAHAAPLTLQVTPLFDESWATVAVKFKGWP